MCREARNTYLALPPPWHAAHCFEASPLRYHLRNDAYVAICVGTRALAWQIPINWHPVRYLISLMRNL